MFCAPFVEVGGAFWLDSQGGPIEVDRSEGGRREGECGMNLFVLGVFIFCELLVVGRLGASCLISDV